MRPSAQGWKSQPFLGVSHLYRLRFPVKELAQYSSLNSKDGRNLVEYSFYRRRNLVEYNRNLSEYSFCRNRTSVEYSRNLVEYSSFNSNVDKLTSFPHHPIAVARSRSS